MKILFVCTGNYYRSRFAEIYFYNRVQGTDLQWEAFSRGFRTSNPGNIGVLSPHTIDWLKQLEIPLPKLNRFPMLLTEVDIKEADRIIALKEDEHRPLVTSMFPEWENKFEYWKINDIQDEAPVSAIQSLKNRVDLLLSSL